jgi:hypothetical protein
MIYPEEPFRNVLGNKHSELNSVLNSVGSRINREVQNFDYEEAEVLRQVKELTKRIEESNKGKHVIYNKEKEPENIVDKLLHQGLLSPTIANDLKKAYPFLTKNGVGYDYSKFTSFTLNLLSKFAKKTTEWLIEWSRDDINRIKVMFTEKEQEDEQTSTDEKG